MAAALLSEVRAASEWVIGRARDVRVREEELACYAEELDRVAAFRLFLDPRYHHLGRGEETVAFIFCLDAVNFGSGWFPWLVKRPGLGGYFTVAAALTERFAAQGPLGAGELAGIDAAACTEIFGQQEAPAEIGELMEHFAGSWRQLGRFLLERFDGDFGALIEEAGRSGERLVALLAEIPSFDDRAEYEGRRVPFYKRAQLTVVDLSLAFSNDGPGRFEDLARLTIFADNQVPHVLRTDRVLEYSERLAVAVESGEELAAGSPPEIEIRAGAVYAAERLAAAMAERGATWLPWQIDQLLWHRGLGAGYEAAPSHRTRTIFY